MHQEEAWLHECASLVSRLARYADWADVVQIEDRTLCGICQHSYALRPGSDPTRFCDSCCQELLEDVLEAARGLVERIDRRWEVSQDKRVVSG